MSYYPMRVTLGARPTGRVTDPLIEPNWWEFPAIFLLGATLAAADIWDWRAEETMNYLAPCWLSLALGVSALQMGMADNRAVWAPLFWFRVATSVYFGVGSIAPLIMNATTRLYIESFYILMASDIQRVNLVVAVGVACVLGGNLVFERLSRTNKGAVHRVGELRVNNNALRIGIGMYLIGFAVHYLLILPNDMGLTHVVVPGFVVNLTAFELVGISLLAIWSFSRSMTAVLSVFTLTALESGIGVLMLSKSAALYPLLAFLIGVLSYRLTLSRLAFAGLFLWFSFSFLQPWLTYARNENAKFQRGGAQSSFSERMTFLTAYFDEKKEENDPRTLQESLLRVSFVNAAAFVISQQDHGIPGNSLTDVLYSFIPRFLWPEKPVIQVAGDLATLATGEVGNSISAGYFAESYWNLGWIGLPLLLLPVGVFFNLTTHFAARTIAHSDWLYLPVMFLNLKVALQIDTWYIGFVGTVAQGFALYLALKFVGQWLRATGFLAPLRSGV